MLLSSLPAVVYRMSCTATVDGSLLSRAAWGARAAPELLFAGQRAVVSAGSSANYRHVATACVRAAGGASREVSVPSRRASFVPDTQEPAIVMQRGRHLHSTYSRTVIQKSQKLNLGKSQIIIQVSDTQPLFSGIIFGQSSMEIFTLSSCFPLLSYLHEKTT